MSTVLLCQAIREELALIVKDLYQSNDPARDREQEFRTPKIINGYVPPRGNDNDVIPYIIVRPSECNTVTESGINYDVIGVSLIVATYGREDGDYEQSVVVLDRVINYFRKKPCLKNKYRMQPKVKWLIPDEQPDPIWFAILDLQWEVPTVQEVLEDDGYNE